ncbi:MAG: hypothetical protein H0T62_14660 [Parachlamydiaceae bacterium]|nr:hypothetical protein [Parachlamydiaceae bacterium]
MEITLLSASNLLPKDRDKLKSQTNEIIIIDQDLVTNEVGMLANISNSFKEILNQTVNYIDRNIDARAVTNNADKIVASLANERDQFMPEEKEWNERIENFVVQYQNEKTNREQVLTTFLDKMEKSYNLEIKILDGVQNVAEKTLAFEKCAMKFTAIGQNIAKTIQLLDTGTLSLIENITDSSDLVVPWIKVGLLSHKISLFGKKIEFLEKELSNAIALIESGALSRLERQECESKIESIHHQIFNFKAEKAQIINEVVQAGMEGSVVLLDKTQKALSDTSTTTLIKEGAQMLMDVSVAAEGAVLAGSVIALGVKFYKVAESSDKFITLKQNIESLKKEHHQERNPIKGVILKAKLDRLTVLEKDISIALVRNILESVVGSMAICSSVQSLLVAAGVTMTATTTLCLNATGVGAIVMGTGLSVGGMAYAAYVHRHEIKHTAATIDIPARRLFLNYQLNKEMQLYEMAKNSFEEASRTLEELQTILPVVWEGKLEIDTRQGLGALEQQKQITRVYLHITQTVNEGIDKATTASSTMSVAIPRLKQLRRELQVLERRQEIEDLQLIWKKLESKFSTFDIYTLIAVKSMVNTSLEDTEDANREEIKNLMLSHKYPCSTPITSEQVFDFIMEDKQVFAYRI